jgi:AcrR family transcriptional regulator
MNSTTNSKRLSRRDFQKLETLNEVRRVARIIFLEKDYNEVSMDEIALAAGVSRNTVYMHFASKAKLLMSVVQEELEAHVEGYQKLADLPRLNHKAVQNWLGDFRRVYDTRRQFWAMWMSTPNLNEVRADFLAAHRELAIMILSKRYPAFRFEALPKAAAQRQKATAYLLLFQIECVTIYFSTVSSSPDIIIGNDILAGRIVEFCSAGADEQG